MDVSPARKRPARWLLSSSQLALLFACGGEIAHSQQNTLPVPQAVVPASAPFDPNQQQADEPAADLAVLESERHLDGSASDIVRAADAELMASAAHTDTVIAPDPGPLFQPVTIEQPGAADALASFHAALQRAAAGEGKARILFYGASHVASDLFTGRIRQALQARFGDAGPGFVMPAKPWPYYRHALVEHVESRGWKAPRVRARQPIEGRFGLAGVALESSDRYAIAKLHTRADGSSGGNSSQLELMYLKQPDGGSLRIVVDGQIVSTLSTAGREAEPAYFQLTTTDGPHDVELHTFADGPVTVFGLTLERDHPGVVLDTVGIPGARARYHLLWDDALYREHVAHRTPDLVVLAYGTNEAGDKDVPIADYEHELRDVVGRLRATAPNASCLLIGPSDRPEKLSDGTYVPRTRVPEIVEAQRRTARDLGCGFFDLVAFMGGPMSMVRWAAASPPFGAPDHVHYTRRGYEALGDVLTEALTSGCPTVPITGPSLANSMR